MNINQQIKQDEKTFGLGKGASFKLKEGMNKVRVLTEAVGHKGSYNGKPTFKYVAWIYDYATAIANADKKEEDKEDTVKLFFMPKSIYTVIGNLQETEGYTFEDFPMPFDILINATGAGTIDVDYQVTGARSNTEVPTEALAQLLEKKPIAEVLAKLKENEANDPSKQPPASQTTSTFADGTPVPTDG